MTIESTANTNCYKKSFQIKHFGMAFHTALYADRSMCVYKAVINSL